MYLFSNGHFNPKIHLKNETIDDNVIDFLAFIKSLSNDSDFKYTATRQLGNSQFSFSLSFFLDNNKFIGDILPAAIITNRIFDETKNSHITETISYYMDYINKHLFKISKAGASFYFKKSFSSIKHITYYELKIRVINAHNDKDDSDIFLRYYFNKKDIPEQVEDNVLILNIESYFKRYIFNELSIKLSLNTIYSEENYEDLMRIYNLSLYQ